MTRKLTLLGLTAIASMGLATSATAGPGAHVEPVKTFVKEHVADLAKDADVIAAVKAANAQTASFDEAKIVEMDKEWRAETSASEQPMIDGVMKHPLSAKLGEAREKTEGMVTEVIVMDAKGLNVGLSDVTSDYWQGDEAKYQEVFGKDGNVVFVDEVEHDESSQTFQSQASFPIVDPESGEHIGVITVGVDIGSLM
ncbi:MAG: hypothetical protein Alpg2KO_08440 [Alphaproteobacteria bacterium]